MYPLMGRGRCFGICWVLVLLAVQGLLLGYSALFRSEKALAPHSSILAWKIPWTEEPGGLQSMGSLRVRHDWATSLSLFTSCIGEGNGNPLQGSYLENLRDGGAWWAAVYGVTQSRTRLKWLSSSSSTLQIPQFRRANSWDRTVTSHLSVPRFPQGKVELALYQSPFKDAPRKKNCDKPR